MKLPANLSQISAAKTLGPYTLLRPLGQGGMGIVWLAYDPALAREVAIKELRSPQPTLLKRLLREARAAARLSHPNVVTIHQVATDRSTDGPDKTYIVMEYLEGGSLADHVKANGPMPWRAALAAIRDAVSGLAAAHDAGLVHRDLKPANLIRAKAGTVKLVDFGLVRIYGEDCGNTGDGGSESWGDLTVPGAFVGSPNYCAPEQAALHPGSLVDARSDIYSLGCTFFTLLTGRPPFVDADPGIVLRAHLEQPWPDPRSLAPRNSLIPDGLCRVLWTCSAKDPAARYQTARELLTALEALRHTPDDSHTFDFSWGADRPSDAPAQHDSRVPLPPVSAEVQALCREFASAMDSGESAASEAAYKRGLTTYLFAPPTPGGTLFLPLRHPKRTLGSTAKHFGHTEFHP